VTIEDQVAAMFARANPVPSLELLDAIEPVDIDRLGTRSERNSMTEARTAGLEESRRSTRTWLFPALATVVMALVAVAGYLNRQIFVADDDTPAEAVAVAYLDALANNDVESLHELVAPTSDVDWNDQTLVHEWRRAAGIVMTRLDCTERTGSGPSGTLVDCPWTYDSDWHRALGLEPSSMQQVFLVKDGKIHEESESSIDDADVSLVWDSFRSWVEFNHGADVATMYDDQNGGARLTPESIALWELYTDEFVAEKEAAG
jgi:hypothetical protein